MDAKTVIYEVNLRVQPEIALDYLAWLKEHVREMLMFPGFLSANLMQEIEDDESLVCFSVQYFIADHSFLQNYLQNHAEKMRNNGISLFANKFSASRRIMDLIESTATMT